MRRASHWDFASSAELARALRSRKLSAAELLEQTIARIELPPQRADTALARGEQRPLLSISVTQKEPFEVAGLPTTWGFQEFKDFVPTEAALAVSRCKQAAGVNSKGAPRAPRKPWLSKDEQKRRWSHDP